MFITRVFLSCSVLSIINLAYTATLRVRGEPLGPPIERACEVHIPDQEEPLKGTCQPKGQCSKYISLPAFHGGSCDTGKETCCIKQLCDLSKITSERLSITNTKYYCTNAENHLDAINSDDHGHMLDYNSDRPNHPAIPYVIPNYWRMNDALWVCPGPPLYNWHGGQNSGVMVCLIDAPMTLSIKGNSQTPTSQGIPQSAIEASDVVADNLLDNEGENWSFDEQLESLPYEG